MSAILCQICYSRVWIFYVQILRLWCSLLNKSMFCWASERRSLDLLLEYSLESIINLSFFKQIYNWILHTALRIHTNHMLLKDSNDKSHRFFVQHSTIPTRRGDGYSIRSKSMYPYPKSFEPLDLDPIKRIWIRIRIQQNEIVQHLETFKFSYFMHILY